MTVPITVTEIIADIPNLLSIVSNAEAAIKALPADASDLQCGVAVLKAVTGPLGDLLLQIEAQAKS